MAKFLLLYKSEIIQKMHGLLCNDSFEQCFEIFTVDNFQDDTLVQKVQKFKLPYEHFVRDHSYLDNLTLFLGSLIIVYRE